MRPVEIFIVAITHVLAWPAVRYWMVYRKVQWKDGVTGKALFNKARSLALLVVISIVGYWWPNDFFLYLYAATLAYLTVAVWYQYRVMRQVLLHRDEFHSPEGAPDAEAPEPVRPDDARREDRRLADEGCATEG